MYTALLLATLIAPTAEGPQPCLTADSLLPAAGAGASVVFEAVYGHCEGASNFRVVQLWIGDEVVPSADRVNLGYEDGMFFIEGGTSCAPMDPVVIHSQFGSLDCAASTVTIAGNQATVRWALELDTVEFAGEHGVFFDAKGGAGDPEPRLGWTQMGTFLVEPGGSGDTGGSTSGVGTSDGDTTSGGGSGSNDEDTKSLTTSGAATGATDPSGGIPAGGSGGRRGALVGCGCASGSGVNGLAWWLAVLLIPRRRRAPVRGRAHALR